MKIKKIFRFENFYAYFIYLLQFIEMCIVLLLSQSKLKQKFVLINSVLKIKKNVKLVLKFFWANFFIAFYCNISWTLIHTIKIKTKFCINLLQFWKWKNVMLVLKNYWNLHVNYVFFYYFVFFILKIYKQWKNEKINVINWNK